MYVDSTPEKFGNAIDRALSYVQDKEPEHRILFLQAWNEWGEGNYMEPDLVFGCEYLEILRKKILGEE
ncbi:glycoside hydrolase family 99-like domain-containing protein [Enterococcus sp. 079]|nr:glycoside hydrolase family 99-like domain-containing protein [Enterococcus sp. 079]